MKRFTGKHMAAIMLGFFGVVIAVNATMAVLASRTFGGTVVDNSYVAGQRFNRWLAEARAQDALGWRVGQAELAEGRLRIVLEEGGAPASGAAITAVAEHPLGRAPEQSLTFESAGEGIYLSRQTLPAGRWIVRLSVVRDGREARFLRDLAP